MAIACSNHSQTNDDLVSRQIMQWLKGISSRVLLEFPSYERNSEEGISGGEDTWRELRHH
jgi:hypothetical protein